jgi:hypothetical protein
LTESVYGVKNRRRTNRMSNDADPPPSSTSDGYVSLVAHIWVGENGKLIRGTIEDAHTGARLALDLSELVAFLQASLAHSPGHVWNEQDEGEVSMHGELPGERYREGLSDVHNQDEQAQE